MIIGLGHKARQGKDWVAEVWQQMFPHHVRKYGFAYELKRYCRANHDELLWKWQLAHQTKAIPDSKSDPVYGCTAILQWYGTSKRKDNPDYWVEKLAERIAHDSPAIAVVCDVRFPNEAEWIKQNAGTLVEVRRVENGKQFIDPGRDPNHISETALDNYDGWDYQIEAESGNTRSLERWARYVLLGIAATKGLDLGGYERLFDGPGCNQGPFTGGIAQGDGDSSPFPHEIFPANS